MFRLSHFKLPNFFHKMMIEGKKIKLTLLAQSNSNIIYNFVQQKQPSLKHLGIDNPIVIHQRTSNLLTKLILLLYMKNSKRLLTYCIAKRKKRPSIK